MRNDNNIYRSLVQSHEIKPLPSPGQPTRGKETPFVCSFELFKSSVSLPTKTQLCARPDPVTFKLNTFSSFRLLHRALRSAVTYTVINLKDHVGMNYIVLVRLKIHFLIMYLNICQPAVLSICAPQLNAGGFRIFKG